MECNFLKLNRVSNIVIFHILDESVLLDLKHLLMEAKQKVPPFLAALQSENEKYLDVGGMEIFTIFYVTVYISCYKNYLFYYYLYNFPNGKAAYISSFL